MLQQEQNGAYGGTRTLKECSRGCDARIGPGAATRQQFGISQKRTGSCSCRKKTLPPRSRTALATLAESHRVKAISRQGDQNAPQCLFGG